MRTYHHLRNKVNMNLLVKKKKKSPRQENYQIIHSNPQSPSRPGPEAAFRLRVVCVGPVGSVEGADGINVAAPCPDVRAHSGCAPRSGPATLRTGGQRKSGASTVSSPDGHSSHCGPQASWTSLRSRTASPHCPPM